MKKKLIAARNIFIKWLLAVVPATLILTSIFSTSSVSATNAQLIDTTPGKIAELKHDLIVRLSQCENVNQNPGLIVYDNNASGSLTGQNVPSIGLLMFKISTVKASYKLQTGMILTDAEAVSLAIDQDKAFALAEFVIFSGKDAKGIDHWHNCNVKHSLSTEVNIIKKLETI